MGRDVKGYINAFQRCLVKMSNMDKQEKRDYLLRDLSPALYKMIPPNEDYSKAVTFEVATKFSER